MKATRLCEQDLDALRRIDELLKFIESPSQNPNVPEYSPILKNRVADLRREVNRLKQFGAKEKCECEVSLMTPYSSEICGYCGGRR